MENIKQIKAIRYYCLELVKEIDNKNSSAGTIAMFAKELIYHLMIYQFTRKTDDPMEPVNSAKYASPGWR